MLAVAAGVALVGPTSAKAADDFEQRLYATVGDWQVRELKTAHAGCHFFRVSDEGNLYGMTYGQSRNRAMLSFALANVKSEGRSNRKLQIFFVSRASEQEQPWGELNFNVIEMTTGGTMFTSDLMPPKFLDDFAANGAIHVYDDGTLVANFPLVGADAAVAKLRECAAHVAVPQTH
jgi:hypothetical protein